MHRKKGAYGYFWSEQWSDGTDSADEIALNPDLMRARTLPETLSTLVHEMCHLEQAHFGKPSRNGYHNKGWADMMDAVGLAPFSIKDPTKRTGQSCSHKITEGGAFDTQCAALMADGFQLDWATKGARSKPKSKSQNKVKYCCPDCDVAAWGKPGLLILCADHNQLMMAVS